MVLQIATNRRDVFDYRYTKLSQFILRTEARKHKKFRCLQCSSTENNLFITPRRVTTPILTKANTNRALSSKCTFSSNNSVSTLMFCELLSFKTLRMNFDDHSHYSGCYNQNARIIPHHLGYFSFEACHFGRIKNFLS